MSSSTNTTITLYEESFLQEFGQIVLENGSNLVILTLFNGIFIPLFSISVYKIIKRGLNHHASWVLLVGTSVNFILLLVEWILLLIWFIINLQTFLVGNANLSLQDRISLEIKAQYHFVAPLDDLSSLPILISDAFVIWRASVLFITNRWAMSIPLFFLLATAGVSFANMAIPSSDFTAGDLFTWLELALSLATNFITTGLIGWRLWMYRKQVLPNLGGNKSPVHKIIVTLIESGTIFCLVQIASLGADIGYLSSPQLNSSISEGAMQEIVLIVATIYPTLIVLICNTQSSHIDEVSSFSLDHAQNSLQFATMQESQSQPMTVSEVDSAQQSSCLSAHEAKSNTSNIQVEHCRTSLPLESLH